MGFRKIEGLCKPTPVKSKAGRQMVPRAGVTVERMKLGAVMQSEDSEDASSHWASPAHGALQGVLSREDP